MDGKPGSLSRLQTNRICLLLTSCPWRMRTMPQVFDNTHKNGVKNFHRSINSRIEPCQKNQLGGCAIIRQVLTIQCQKWIIDTTFVLVHPDQQFGLDINCSPFRVVLAQCSSTSYKVINPELGITIFDTILGLLILYILGNTQTGQFDLGLDIQEDPFSGTSNTSLDISIW